MGTYGLTNVLAKLHCGYKVDNRRRGESESLEICIKGPRRLFQLKRGENQLVDRTSGIVNQVH